MSSTLSNWEIAVYALYLEGGISRLIHTEDVALKCFELAPESFTWVKHQHLPDKEVARSALVDARKEKYGALVSGRAGKNRGHFIKKGQEPSLDGWRLTEDGVRWVTENELSLAQKLTQVQPKTHRQQLLQKLARVQNHQLFQAFRDQPEGFTPSLGALAELLRCRVDTDKSIWDKRFATLRNQAQLARQDDMLDFLKICQSHVDSTITVQRS